MGSDAARKAEPGFDGLLLLISQLFDVGYVFFDLLNGTRQMGYCLRERI